MDDNDEHNFNSNFNYNIIELNEKVYNNDDEDEDDEEEQKSSKELIYDIIHDNYNYMKNTLLILRKRLINNQEIKGPLKVGEMKNILENNSQNNDIKKPLNGKLKVKYQKKKHSKYSLDNLFYKIKVLYHKFIICLTNDIYNNCNSSSLDNIFIRKISGDNAKINTKAFNKDLGKLSLKELLSKSISSVYTNTSENINRENIESLYNNKEKYKILINLLEYNYKDFFQNFYIKENCVEIIEANFNIKKRTYISFKESMEKLSTKENDDYINKLIEVANNKFILFLEGKKIKYNTKLNDFI